jgi:hypothetical protein
MKTRRRLILVPTALLLLCFLTVAGLAFANRFRPTASEVVDRLSQPEKARLAEVTRLRQEAGQAVWPGWEQADIPLVVYNETNAFLVGFQGEPPPGWQPVPGDESIGGSWERVPGDTFFGEPYYRTPLPAPDVTPQAFTVRIGDAWAASMPTQEWARIQLADQFNRDLPVFLKPVFPYGLAVRLFLGGSDKYISLMLHESFHAYQGMTAQERLETGEQAGRTIERRYPWDNESLEAAWQAELDLLAEAAEQAQNGATIAELKQMAWQFLEMRGARREEAGLSSDQIVYEQLREWVEGQAKYVEMRMWQAGTASPYTPHPATTELDNFDSYQGADRALSQEIQQIRRMAGDEGDGRFYYSGLAQALLLDRLMPGWQSQALAGTANLEDLLAAAIASNVSRD